MEPGSVRDFRLNTFAKNDGPFLTFAGLGAAVSAVAAGEGELACLLIVAVDPPLPPVPVPFFPVPAELSLLAATAASEVAPGELVLMVVLSYVLRTAANLGSTPRPVPSVPNPLGENHLSFEGAVLNTRPCISRLLALRFTMSKDVWASDFEQFYSGLIGGL